MSPVEGFLNGFLTESLSSIYNKGEDIYAALKNYVDRRRIKYYEPYYKHITCVVNDEYDYQNNIQQINGGLVITNSTYNWNNVTERTLFECQTIYSLFPFAIYKKYKEIDTNEKYFYPIFLNSNDYFIENEKGFKVISENILNDVRNNKAKIVLFFPTEGYSGSNLPHYEKDLIIIQSWIDEVNIPSNNVYYIGGNLCLEEVARNDSRIKFNCKGISTFETWNNFYQYSDIKLEFKPADVKYLYLNMNRMPRRHRLIMLLKLADSGLFNVGRNSFNLMYGSFVSTANHYCWEFNKEKEYTNRLCNIGSILDEYKVLNIDTDTTPNLAINLNIEIFEKTFISLVTETLAADNCIFFTEKIWKPIIIGHPFIVLSGNNTLALLKEYGFRTFDKWIDESYDEASNFDIKTDIIINNLKKFNGMTVEQLKAIRNEMKEVCDHNRIVFGNIYRQKFCFPDESGNNTIVMGGLSSVGCRPVADILVNIKKTWA